jgi:cytochrome c peroxidase
MLSVLRVSARRAPFSVPTARVQLRASVRTFSTPPQPPPTTPPPPPAPKSKSNTSLYAGLGLAALGVAFYVYNSQSTSAKEAGGALKSGTQIAKAKAGVAPTKEDYQKVWSLTLWTCADAHVDLHHYSGLQQNC